MAIDTPATIAVLGAGPTGLEAALYARYLGFQVLLLEAGDIAEHLRRYGHVRLGTTFGEIATPLGIAALRAQDAQWQPPADALLTGEAFREAYLLPLAASDLLAETLDLRTRVVSVGRPHLRKGELARDASRGDSMFAILVEHDGVESTHEADAVLDCTGTFHTPTPLGYAGIEAIGERRYAADIEYGLPDVLGRERDHYAGQRTLVVGQTHLAAANIVALEQLARECPGTWITWSTDSPPRYEDETGEPSPAPLTRFDDSLPAPYQATMHKANELAKTDANHIDWFADSAVTKLARQGEVWHVEFTGEASRTLEVDRIVASTPRRICHELFASLHIGRDAIDGTPVVNEPHFYVLGEKTHVGEGFLMRTSRDQIRAAFAGLTDRPTLDLYASVAHLAG